MTNWTFQTGTKENQSCYCRKETRRKRHIIVDTMGLVIEALVHSAGIQEMEVLKEPSLGLAGIEDLRKILNALGKQSEAGYCLL